MLTQASSASTWFSDAHTVLSVVGILMMGAMSLIGYKVHSVLFNMKIPERMATLEGSTVDLENRINKLEKKVFDL